ncbi:thymidine kinase [Fastidiosibacter lacustris]|uniref:thymidine kinase n=1 Tax=Fastidiosibacter lacustris TaxID=2056695 RepID=UPI001EFCA7BC|nr:thymidine kinase [Fastidiosibacter lacustris]
MRFFYFNLGKDELSYGDIKISDQFLSMAKLHFYYSTMNAGKSTTLLQSDYNYRERGMYTLLFAPKFDDRYGLGKITSRLGLQADAVLYDKDTDLYAYVYAHVRNYALHCVLIDEAQFLTKAQVLQLSDVVDVLNIPVLAYGLRNDFQAEPFEGSKYLLTWADQLIEIKTICHCGKKATHVLRLGENGQVVKEGDQLQIGGNDHYVSVCRKHFKDNLID